MKHLISILLPLLLSITSSNQLNFIKMGCCSKGEGESKIGVTPFYLSFFRLRKQFDYVASRYIAYKLPKLASSSDNLQQEGSKYYYILPGKVSWTPSEFPINSNRSLLATTLEPFWNKDEKMTDLSYLLYNDQPPAKPAVVINGHTKGLVLSSNRSGVWLQHSCPHFPDISASDNFTSSYPLVGGLINGQLFMCMTFNRASVIDGIGRILEYTKPLIYNFSIPPRLDNLFPELRRVGEKNEIVKRAPWFNVFEMDVGEIKNGSNDNNDNDLNLHLKVFAKGPKFHREVYSSWIAPEVESGGLDVQSWLNGAHPFTSNCSSVKYPVYNVLTKGIDGQNFSYVNDHSKWAVGRDEGKPVVCIGDLNRMKPQKFRGGVTICFEHKDIWRAFRGLVVQTQPCETKNSIL